MKKNNRDFDKILNKIKEVEERDGICIYGDIDHPLTKEDLKNMSEKEILELLLFIIDTDEYEPNPQDSRKEKIEKVMKMIDDMSMVLNVNFYDGSLGQALSKEDIICLTKYVERTISESISVSTINGRILKNILIKTKKLILIFPRNTIYTNNEEDRHNKNRRHLFVHTSLERSSY